MGAWEDRDESSQPERRSDPRYSVDEESVVLFVGYGAPLEARLVDLSQEGCRIRTKDPVNTRSRLPVEVFFKVNGISFRFRGVLQWTDGHNLLGIRFVNVVPKRMVELANVICTMEEASEARAEEVNLLVAEQLSAQATTPATTEARAGPQPVRKPVGRERRQQSRHVVDTSATILLVNVGSTLRGRILDLSLTGCRIHTDAHFPVGIYTRVETEFRCQGLPFRLGGVIQAIHDRNTVGIRFIDLSERKRGQVLDLIGEIEETHAVRRGAPEEHAG